MGFCYGRRGNAALKGFSLVQQLRRPLLFLLLFLVFSAMAYWLIARGNSNLASAFLTTGLLVPAAWIGWDRYQRRHQVMRLKEEALRAELAALKNQINPHFFFNTLNNLYSLSVAGSERTPEMILVLSELMRFTIYEGKKDHVALQDEVDYLRHYIALQRIRVKGDIEVEFEVALADPWARIPPLMLMILLENAFKHGVATLTEDAYIHLVLRATEEKVFFEVCNNFDPQAAAKEPGIGMANLKRRLQLTYGRDYRLEYGVEGDCFTAYLELATL